jgi:hypothetical protein
MRWIYVGFIQFVERKFELVLATRYTRALSLIAKHLHDAPHAMLAVPSNSPSQPNERTFSIPMVKKMGTRGGGSYT